MQCRVCRTFNCEVATDMSNVEPTDRKTLYDYFNDCTQLNATNSDDLPKTLCMNCTQNLKQAYNFRCQARRSDEELKWALSLTKNLAILACDSAGGNQSKMLEDIEDSTFQLLAVSPKRPTTCHYYPDISNVLQDIEAATFDQQSGSTKNNPSNVCETSEQPQDININSPIDPLAVSENSDAKTLNTMIEDPRELQMLKEEIKLELSTDVIENADKDQMKDSMPEGKEENSDLRELNRKKTCYACDYCNYKCVTQTQLKEHIFQQHKDTIICGKCCKVFELPKELQLHNQLVHEIASPMCCRWCQNSTPTPKKVLAKHLKEKHNDIFLKFFPRVHILRRGENDPYSCERCKKCFKSMHEVANHMQEHTYDCPLCDMKFKKKATYKAHIQRIHNQTQTSLKTLLADRDRQLKQNKREEGISKLQNDINSMDGQSAADDVSGQQIRFSDAEESDTDTESIESFKCKNKPLSKKEREERRLANKLRGPKKYICAYCPREFLRQKNVRLHENKVHLCEKPALEKCPVCEKEVNATYLKTHIANVHNSDRNLACDVCGDLFKTTKLLFHHKQLHLDRKHPCTVCKKRFICASELKVHMRMHTGETPFQCHLCAQRFKIRGALTYHLQRHAGIKRKCEVCGKEFDRIENLKNHTFLHTGFPYRCYMCDFKNVKREALRKHLLDKHGTTITVDELVAMFKANTGRWPRVRVANNPS